MSAGPALGELASELAGLVRGLYAQGWCVATSGNFSRRVDAERVLITASGRDKGRVQAADMLLIDLQGQGPLEGSPGQGRPSAETRLHTQLYARPEVGAVLHVHTQAATLLSRAEPEALLLEGYEMLKAFGLETHTGAHPLPVVDNSQDMEELSAWVAPLLEREGALPGYLIRGHGLYTWGRDLGEASRHLEAFEFLLSCALQERLLRGGKP